MDSLGGLYTGSDLSLIDAGTPTTTQLVVRTDVAKEYTVILRLTSAEGYNTDVTFSTMICGFEKLVVSNTTKVFNMFLWVSGDANFMSESDRYQIYT